MFTFRSVPLQMMQSDLLPHSKRMAVPLGKQPMRH